MSLGFSRPALALVLFALGCGANTSAPSMPPAPEPTTQATLAGPLCESQSCTCTDDPAAAGEAPEGFKRFKVELGPSESELWGTIDGNTFYKGVERATECYYVDLAVGDHPMSVRAKAASGKASFGARMLVSEIGAAGPWFFDSFEFRCGAPGLCDNQALSEWKQWIATDDAGKHAPCGSVRILGVDWQTGRMPDNVHPEDFFLEATMKIYKFLPHNPPGTAECKKE